MKKLYYYMYIQYIFKCIFKNLLFLFILRFKYLLFLLCYLLRSWFIEWIVHNFEDMNRLLDIRYSRDNGNRLIALDIRTNAPSHARMNIRINEGQNRWLRLAMVTYISMTIEYRSRILAVMEGWNEFASRPISRLKGRSSGKFNS